VLLARLRAPLGDAHDPGRLRLPAFGQRSANHPHRLAGKWTGTINPGHNSFADPFYLTITPDGKLTAGWRVNTSWGTVNGQATFEMQPPISEGTIRLYLDGGRRTLFMDGVLPSFSAQVTPQG
jgi:hypothetical protein